MLHWFDSIPCHDCSLRSIEQSLGWFLFRNGVVAQVKSYHTIHVHGIYAISKAYEVIASSMLRSIWDDGDIIPVRVEGKVRDQVQSTAMLIRLSRRNRGWLTSSPVSPLIISPRVIIFFFTTYVVLFSRIVGGEQRVHFLPLSTRYRA